MTERGNFGEGRISLHLTRQALPIFVAELVHVLYNIVDRMFLGRIPGEGVLALSGGGIVFPLITLINAFSSLFGQGGSPLCAIARGKGNDDLAKRIMATSFTMMILTGAILTIILYFSMDLFLSLMGATAENIVPARQYFSVYLFGTIFVMISLGMNPFINMQGNSGIGMVTVIIGAALNCILDPIFIFTLGLGVRGAAIATVISQFLSATWVVLFLKRKTTKIRLERLLIDWGILRKITKLGVTGFMFKSTTSLTQAVANNVLKLYAGAAGTLYIGAMSLVNSVREITFLPTSSITASMQPIAGYNYGAKKYSRVRNVLKLTGAITLVINGCIWLLIELRPQILAGMFTQNPELLATSSASMRIYFAALIFMVGQMMGQNTFVSLNCPKRALFFSLFRKVILVVPFTIIFPIFMGINGVFIAEAVSQLVGGSACFLTMLFTIYRKLIKTKDGEELTV